MKTLIAIDEESCEAVISAVLERNWSPTDEFRIASVLDAPTLDALRRESHGDVSGEDLSQKFQGLLDTAELRMRKALPLCPIKKCTLNGAVANAISKEANSSGVDLIAVGSHRRRGMDRLMSGSVSCDVLRETHCSMLIIPVNGIAKQGVI
jgi:nucleotide-binding universal stress UspA family protein